MLFRRAIGKTYSMKQANYFQHNHSERIFRIFEIGYVHVMFYVIK